MKKYYRIYRYYSDGRKPRLMYSRVTLTFAQIFCSGPNSKGQLKSGTTWEDHFSECGKTPAQQNCTTPEA